MPDTSSKGYTRRSGPRDRGLRVSDTEREAVADILREQHLQGRLTSDEFHERLDHCLTAKTYAELDALVADFPATEARSSQGRGCGWRPWPFVLVPFVLIAIAASGGHLFWLAFPLIFFFVIRPLLWRSRGFRGRGMWACGPRYRTGNQA
jgi:DUF1707 SHOCT-like domain